MSKKIVVTGATKGIGQALCREFAKLGHTVYGCGRSKSAVAAIQDELGSPHQIAQLDVSDDEAVSRWAGHICQAAGAPDLVINNAAAINRNASLWEVPYDEFNNLLQVNIRGVYSVIRHLLPAMLDKGSGVIVNLSSGWGRSVSAEVAPYCATKFAIEGLTRALADELPDGLAAIPVSPGIVNTDMLQSCFGAGADSAPKPKPWAKTAAPWLLSLNAQHNGQSLTTP